MAYAKALAVGLIGLDGHLVEVEADLAAGVPNFVLSGLPDAAVCQARDRVRAAVLNSGGSWPNRRITVNLLPAFVPKRGSGFDLAVAVAVLGADGVLPAPTLDQTALIGELGLDGSVRAVTGVLPAVLAAWRAGIRRAVVPAGNVREAQLVPGMRAAGVSCLREVVNVLRGDLPMPDPLPPEPPSHDATLPDLRDVVGQQSGRRAIEVAAAGGHNLAFFGSPGSGKTMLAERLPSILPALDDTEALEVTAVHSIAGLLPADAPLIRRPPFQAPHHTATSAALVGGGSGLARPGMVTLAHRGVLFLDEVPEYRPSVLDALREPLEKGEITLARARGGTRYPARVQLVLAANPCQCAGPGGDQECTCTAAARRRYLGRISGPLLDRVDIQIELLPVGAVDLLGDETAAEPSHAVAERVLKARAAAAERWAVAGHAWRTNAEVPASELRSSRWRLPRSVTLPAERQVDRGQLSARGYHRLLRLAWTLADLAGRDRPDVGDVAEATVLRIRGMR
ncbi:MAG: YifB family Mg chelatase-like AAA ATPase [Micromonosporaceae bacterium]